MTISEHEATDAAQVSPGADEGGWWQLRRRRRGARRDRPSIDLASVISSAAIAEVELGTGDVLGMLDDDTLSAPEN